MAVSLHESVREIFDPVSLDATVEEVFRLMLGVDCQRGQADLETEVDAEQEAVTAVVGLGGVLTGACVLHSGNATAREIAARMTGAEFQVINDTVKDGIGELCNMLAGAWKGRVPELAAHCALSVPAVITGCDYHLHVQEPKFQLHHVYRFDGGCFDVMIVCDGLR